MAQFENAASCWKTILSDVTTHRGLLSVIEKFAREKHSTCKNRLRHIGMERRNRHRLHIQCGEDCNLGNHRTVQKKRSRFHGRRLAYADFDEIKKRGIIVGHDNRFLGPEFAKEVIGLLQKEGIRTWYAGEAPTPAFSAGIEMLHAACAINLTPSHNPANYAGFKFNPSDGGPAGSEITAPIEEAANRMMRESLALSSVDPGDIEKTDLTDLYIQFITERKTLDIERIRAFIRNGDCIICIDNVHGSTRGCVERILGKSVKIHYLRTENDFLFGGIAPEPSEKNMHGVEKVLKESTAGLKLGVIMDPDGDRIRYSDGSHTDTDELFRRDGSPFPPCA